MSGRECDLLFSDQRVVSLQSRLSDGLKDLITFQLASDHLQELKTELKGIFKDQEIPRTKRVLRVEKDSGETTAAPCRWKLRNVYNFRSIPLDNDLIQERLNQNP
ncbi:hypothetical protein ACROYT_G028759 [Oculina patagonica]